MRSKYKFKSGKFFLFLIVLILFIIFISLLFVNNKFKSKIQNPGINVDVINEKGKEEIISKTEDKKDKVISNSSITIPAIFLNDAPIKEGIEQGVLNEYIGHFPTTSNLDGNVGLAAHNRGYNKNYFSKLHAIKIGDEIIYKIGENIKLTKD